MYRVIKELNQFTGRLMATFGLSAIPSGCERTNILLFLSKIPAPLDHHPRQSYISEFRKGIVLSPRVIIPSCGNQPDLTPLKTNLDQ